MSGCNRVLNDQNSSEQKLKEVFKSIKKKMLFIDNHLDYLYILEV